MRKQKVSSYFLIAFGIAGTLSALSLEAGEKTTFYKVTEETPSLCTVGIFLYGSCKKAAEIALWNQIENLNQVRLGQKLALQKRPSLTPEEGNAALLKAFRKKFQLVDIVTPRSEILIVKKEVKLQVQEELQKPKADFKKLEKIAEKPAQIMAIEDEVRSVAPRVPPPAVVKAVRERVIEEDFDKGKEYFEQKKYDEALGVFQLNRRKNPRFLPTWIFEIRTLQALKRESEVEPLVLEMVTLHPQTRLMPLIRPYLQNGVGQ